MKIIASFMAQIMRGAGRGRRIGSPTLNLQLPAVPFTLKHGIYACTVTWNRKTFPAAMHFGPRPVFRAGIACEVHVIGLAVRRPPRTVTVTVVRRLRSVQNFPTPEALQRQIRHDLKKADFFLKRKSRRR